MSCLKLIGKKETFDSVKAAFKSKRAPHAILISGEKGVGKKVFADAVCRLILCEGEDAPCENCLNCQKIDKGIHPDVFKIFPAGKSQTIGVKEIEVVKHNIFVKPNDADYKIFLIYNAERMNVNSQNAMLKMIEEPPEDTFFVFTCENVQSLLPTVRSRVTAYRLSNADVGETKNELALRFGSENADKINRAAALSNGNIGLAISLCEDEETVEIYDDAERISLAICSKDKAELCLALGKYEKKKEDAVRLITVVKQIFRDVCAHLSGSGILVSGNEDAVKRISSFCSAKSALNVMSACDEFMSAVSGNANLALSLAAFEVKINNFVKR